MYTVPALVSGQGGPYVAKADALAFIKNIMKNFPDAALTDDLMTATTEMIDNRTQPWGIFSGSIFITGRNESWVNCPITPIVTLTAVNEYALDGTFQSLIVGPNPYGGLVNGQEAEVIWDPLSGQIKRVNDINLFIDINTLDETPTFREYSYKENVELVGTFGRGPYKILGLLQELLLVQALGYQFPDLRKENLVREKIGDYEYQLNPMERSGNLRNMRLTLEGYINQLFDQLPKLEGENYLAI